MQEKTLKNTCIGDCGEVLAARHLLDLGFEVIDRNIRYKCGEIDIVAMRNGELHFVEVKARRASSFIDPLDGVTDFKKARIKKAARIYINKNFKDDDLPACYFDVIGIVYRGERADIEFIHDAFD